MVDTTAKSNHYLIGLLVDDATSYQLLRIATLSSKMAEQVSQLFSGSLRKLLKKKNA